MNVLLRVLVGVLCFAPLAQADAPLIFCKGSACGDQGRTAYAYPIDSVSYPMVEFVVGTNDLDPRNYDNVLIPHGWNFKIEDDGKRHDHGRFAPHGTISTGPCRCLTAGRVRWWTDDPQNAIESFVFGYDHPWLPEDVAWTLTTRREGPPPREYVFTEFWDSPVGMGTGPAHGPSRAASGQEQIKKAKCKTRRGEVKKVTVKVKYVTPMANYGCKLDTGEQLFKQAKPNGKIKFIFSGDNAPPCGPNGATVYDQYKPFDCNC